MLNKGIKMNITVKNLIKKTIKNTRYYQNKKFREFIQGEKYTRLSSDEKTDYRVCYYKDDKQKQFAKLLKLIQIDIHIDSRFQHWIDTGLYFFNVNHMIDALPPNYELILNYSLIELIDINRNLPQSPITRSNIFLLQSISEYIHRIINELTEKIDKNTNENLAKTKDYFSRMLIERSESLEEGMQRVLFWSSLFWQTGHLLIGLGRLDKIFSTLEMPSDDRELELLITDFCKELHRYYEFKSNDILGDTGQVVILGGSDEQGNYFYNRLTYAFISAMKKIRCTDPKIVLRVTSKTPEDLLKLSTECISTGIGYPLFANDDVIIPALLDFDYCLEDAVDYVTSACWEPLAYGKGFGRGNLTNINYADVLVKTFKDDLFIKCSSFKEILSLYKIKLRKEVKSCLSRIDTINWEKDPLMTFFTKSCIDSEKDISEGGAKYSDYGILSVGLANAIDSLFNIEFFVFSEKKYTLSDLKEAAEKNFVNYPDIQNSLSQTIYFGTETPDVFRLIQELTDEVAAICNTYHNRLGGRVKFGLSSPNYIDHGCVTEATLDGRKKGKPLSVHISSKHSIPFTELINFSGILDYSGIKSNGNVVDFFVAPAMFKTDYEKFIRFIKSSIKVGFFEMQINVVDSKTLIEAKKFPEKFPNLIVRVWGFSSYFNDLPENYKNLLIQRALESEISV